MHIAKLSWLPKFRRLGCAFQPNINILPECVDLYPSPQPALGYVPITYLCVRPTGANKSPSPTRTGGEVPLTALIVPRAAGLPLPGPAIGPLSDAGCEPAATALFTWIRIAIFDPSANLSEPAHLLTILPPPSPPEIQSSWSEIRGKIQNFSRSSIRSILFARPIRAMAASIPTGEQALRSDALEIKLHVDYTSCRPLSRMVNTYSTRV